MKNSKLSRSRENITISLPIELIKQLKLSVEPRKMSSYITIVLQERLDAQNEALKRAYLASNNDPETQQLIKDWSVLDVEGLDNEEW